MGVISCLTFLMVGCIVLVNGFEDGMPAWMCPSGVPYHGNADPQTGTPTAAITLSQYTYNANDPITVTLTGNFEGFAMRAQRTVSATSVDTTKLQGAFTSPFPTSAKGLAWMADSGVTYNCVTHSDEDDFTSLTFTWVAPSASVGDITFTATVVEDFEIYWDNIQSPTLVANTPESPTESTASKVYSDFSNFNFEDSCGNTKGCLKYPSGCSGSNCDTIISYEGINSGTEVKFEMSAALDTGYLSLGFSSDIRMGDELTVNCIRSVDTLYVTHSFDTDYNIRQLITDLTDIHIASQNGRLYCSFTRAVSLTYTEGGTTTSKTSNLNSNVYLFAATGDVFYDRDTVKKHEVLPMVSSKKINVLSTKISTGTHTPVLIGAHVTFGILGYFVLCGFAMLIARHYRDILNKPVCGAGIWFQLHRGSMFPMIIFGVIAIILALVSIGGWNGGAIATTHGIFGILATVMMLVNIIMGMKRPGGGAPKRPMYNLAHRICAMLAYVFTIICMLLGANVDVMHPDFKSSETIMIAVGFGIQIIIEIVLEVLRCRPVSKTDNYDMDGKDKEEEEKEKDKKGCNWVCKIAILAIYIFAALAIAIAAMVMAFTI